MSNTKKCTKCGEVKGVGEFYKEKRNKNGLRADCKICLNAVKTKYQKENSEKIKARQAKYRKENPKKVKASKTKWRKENPEKLKARTAKRKEKNHIAFLKREGLLEFKIAEIFTNIIILPTI